MGERLAPVSGQAPEQGRQRRDPARLRPANADPAVGVQPESPVLGCALVREPPDFGGTDEKLDLGVVLGDQCRVFESTLARADHGDTPAREDGQIGVVD